MVLLLLVLLMLLLLVLLVLRGRTALRRTILELALVPMLHIRLLLGLLRLIRMLGVDLVRLMSGVGVDVLRHGADLPLLHFGRCSVGFWVRVDVVSECQGRRYFFSTE